MLVFSALFLDVFATCLSRERKLLSQFWEQIEQTKAMSKKKSKYYYINKFFFPLKKSFFLDQLFFGFSSKQIKWIREIIRAVASSEGLMMVEKLLIVKRTWKEKSLLKTYWLIKCRVYPNLKWSEWFTNHRVADRQSSTLLLIKQKKLQRWIRSWDR